MDLEILLSFCVGLGLSAACGFRIFVPLLMMSLAANTGHLQLAPGFQWIATTPALIAFAVATILEIGAYYIPWLDHLLDTLATPAAVVAGTLITASMVTGLSPFLRWTLALIAGGAAATLVQGTTVLVRGVSTATTGGLANPIVATMELGGSLLTSVIALLAPPVALLLVAALVYFVGRKLVRGRARSIRQSGLTPI